MHRSELHLVALLAASVQWVLARVYMVALLAITTEVLGPNL